MMWRLISVWFLRNALTLMGVGKRAFHFSNSYFSDATRFFRQKKKEKEVTPKTGLACDA